MVKLFQHLNETLSKSTGSVLEQAQFQFLQGKTDQTAKFIHDEKPLRSVLPYTDIFGEPASRPCFFQHRRRPAGHAPQAVCGWRYPSAFSTPIRYSPAEDCPETIDSESSLVSRRNLGDNKDARRNCANL